MITKTLYFLTISLVTLFFQPNGFEYDLSNDEYINIPTISLQSSICYFDRNSCLKNGVWLKYFNIEDSNFLLTGHNFFFYPVKAGVFYNLSDISIGDLIDFKFKERKYVYEVREIYITNRYDMEVESFVNKRDLLIIYTCHPNWYNSHRFVVEASRVTR